MTYGFVSPTPRPPPQGRVLTLVNFIDYQVHHHRILSNLGRWFALERTWRVPGILRDAFRHNV